MIRVKATVSFHEYRNLLLGLTYRKPVMKLLLSVALSTLVWIIGYYSHTLPVPHPTFYQFTTLALICIVQPIIILGTIRKNYFSNKHLMEPAELEFTKEELKIKGPSFSTQMTWDKMYKLEEVKSWFLAYPNNLSAYLIPKKSFTAETDKEFRQLIQSVSGVRVNMKNDKAKKNS